MIVGKYVMPSSLEACNLQAIFQRRQGEKFKVVQGRLQVVQGTLDTIAYYLFRPFHLRQVRKVISNTVTILTSKRLNSIQTVNGQPGKEEFVRELFYTKMARISSKVFDRKKVHQDCVDLLMPSLRISEKQWKEKKAACAPKDEIKMARFHYKFQAVTLALKLGVEFKRLPGGSSGSYLGMDRFKRPLLVFKPHDEEPTSGNSPKIGQKIKNLIRKIFPCFAGHKCLKPQQGYLAEEAASLLDQWLQLGIVPKTRIVPFTSSAFHTPKHRPDLPEGVLQEKIGSCQEFKDNSTAVSDIMGVSSCLPPYIVLFFLRFLKGKAAKIIPKKEFEKMVVLDFILAHLDRHYSNWLIRRGNGSKPAKLIAIDNGLSLPFQHPDDYFSKRYQYYWKHLPQAKMPFGEGALQIIKEVEKDPEGIIQLLEAHMPEPGQKETMRERIRVLCKFVKAKKTPYELGSIKIKENFEAINFAEDPATPAARQ